MSNIDEKFDKAEKVVDRTKSLVIKIISALVGIGLALYVGLNQLAGDEEEYYNEAEVTFAITDSLEFNADTLEYEEAEGH